ncbi:MAG: hypothetical protein J6S26_05335 [Solobacterium sp.]|nr:hypothetical protein [Solobacterium sp.]
MKKLLLIAGIVLLTAGVLFLLFGLFSRFGYYHVLDGSNALYSRLHRRMVIGFTAGSVLGVIGAVCLIIQAKL